jgi:hypothetical protein
MVSNSQHQINKMHSVVPQIFILQDRIEHCYMFRSLGIIIRESYQSNTTQNKLEPLHTVE